MIWVTEEVGYKKMRTADLRIFQVLVVNVNIFKSKEQDLIKKCEHFGQLNSSKDRFISILSHDLRAPFTSILGFSEILMNEKTLSENEKIEYLNYIHESSQTQLQLINYLLDWSRLHTGRMKIEPHRLNAQKVTYNSVSALTGNAIRKNIEIRVIIDDNIHIEADERLITQVITNLAQQCY